MGDKIRTPGELAEYLDSTVGTLAHWRYVGKGPKFIKLGRNVRYRDSDIQEWLDQQTRTQTGERISA